MTTMYADAPKYPEIVVQLSGEDGNAFNVMGIVAKALRHNGHGDEVSAFMNEAMEGDYNHLLQTAMRWVEVE